jgi:hypothetical protein
MDINFTGQELVALENFLSTVWLASEDGEITSVLLPGILETAKSEIMINIVQKIRDRLKIELDDDKKLLP